MAPLPPVANVMKYTQSYVLGGNTKAESILHFQYTGGTPSASDCAAFAADFQAAFASNLKALLCNLFSIGIGTVLDLNSNTGAEGIGGSNVAGTHSGSLLPASTAVVFNHAIARRYRGGKPRTYCPFGIQTDLASAGLWTTGFQTSCNTNWALFQTNALAATSSGITISNIGCVSYYLNKALRTTPVFEPFTSTTARQRIGTQRRRNKTA